MANPIRLCAGVCGGRFVAVADAEKTLGSGGVRNRIHGRGFSGHHRSPKSGGGKCRSGVATLLAGALALRRIAAGMSVQGCLPSRCLNILRISVQARSPRFLIRASAASRAAFILSDRRRITLTGQSREPRF